MFAKLLSKMGVGVKKDNSSMLAALDDVLRPLQSLPLLETGVLLSQVMSKPSYHQHILELTITLPIGFSGNPQQLHDQIVAAVTPLGVQEVNLYLIQATSEKTSTSYTTSKSTSMQQMPKTVNAMPTPPTASSAPTQASIPAHPYIEHVVVVASGKGGVGKSTTTVNLALALKAQGLKVGILDADIYGPSIPTMLNVAGKTPVIEDEKFVPLEAYGLAVLSIGNLIGADNTPIVWRGPKATGALMQLYGQTLWPKLDVLLIDMPPGTGDIQLTLAQRIPVSGAVIVTTPQHVALLDAQKGIEMFNKVHIPVLGVVENMSVHICSQCGHVDEVFGGGGGDTLSTTYHVPLLGRLPLDGHIRIDADNGKPTVLVGGKIADMYMDIATAMLAQLAKIPARMRNTSRII